jgi:hypothetical protein
MLTIRQARGESLLAVDHNGLCDPYIIFDLGKDHFQLPVKYKTRNPEWNDFEYNFTIENFPTDEVFVELWDKDMIGKNELGLVKIKVSELLKPGETSLKRTKIAFPIKAGRKQKEGLSYGTLHLDIELKMSVVRRQSSRTRIKITSPKRSDADSDIDHIIELSETTSKSIHGSNKTDRRGSMEQKNIATGVAGLASGVLSGVTGVLTEPIKGGMSGGVGGAVKGIGKGVSGLITKPVQGALSLVTDTASGMQHSMSSGNS